MLFLKIGITCCHQFAEAFVQWDITDAFYIKITQKPKIEKDCGRNAEKNNVLQHLVDLNIGTSGSP